MVENESTECATRHELCHNNSCDAPIVLQDEERTHCETWTRVMGYFRPVSEWNIGKKQEFADRQYFSANKALDRIAQHKERMA
jgi:anaerobic ribonucleoside-triphosphate reductase